MDEGTRGTLVYKLLSPILFQEDQAAPLLRLAGRTGLEIFEQVLAYRTHETNSTMRVSVVEHLGVAAWPEALGQVGQASRLAALARCVGACGGTP